MWSAVRLIGHKKDLELQQTFPRVQALNGWKIFLGQSAVTGLDLFTDIIDQTWFESVRNSQSKVHGPAVNSSESDNISVKWENHDIFLIGHDFMPIKLQNSLTESGLFSAFVPTLDQNPIPINYKGPFGSMEVQTRIWNDKRTLFMRLEQFSPLRIPLMEYNVWREASNGAYSSWINRKETLQKLSTASYCWSFSARVIFESSGWDIDFQELSSDKSNYLACLGFETNNPIHDDHDGKGPHFHLSLRSKVKEIAKSPAFYMNPENGKVSIELNTKFVELTTSGFFGVVRMEGDLGIGPIVRLKNVRSGMYMYCRESETGYNKGIFQTELGEMNDNNTWILLSNDPSSFLLCNIRGSCYVNVDKDHTKIVDHLYQSLNFNTPGSNWKFKLSKNGNWLLQNIMSQHYLHAFNTTHALPMAQFDQENDGSEWLIDYKSGNKWIPIKSFEDIPNTYTIKFNDFNEFSAASQIYRNGHLWSHVQINRKFTDQTGLLGVDVNFENDSSKSSNYKIAFDKLTGKEL